METAIHEMNPEIKSNLHAVPWRNHDFNNAIRRIAGQDITDLSGMVDYVSPMCYSHMVKRKPEWVSEVVNDFNQLSKRNNILPSIQVSRAYLATDISLDEFRQCLEQSLKPPSCGVVFWSWDALSSSPDKRRIVQEVITGQ